MKKVVLVLLVFLIQGAAIGSLAYAVHKNGTVKVTTAECPYLAPNVVQNIVEFEGWKCEANKGSFRDLVQPDGLWVRQTFDCWKHEQTLEEFEKSNPNWKDV
jgi:hypothetical protein